MYGKFGAVLQQELASIREQGLYKDERVLQGPQGAERRRADARVLLAERAQQSLDVPPVAHPTEGAEGRAPLVEVGRALVVRLEFAQPLGGLTMKAHDVGQIVSVLAAQIDEELTPIANLVEPLRRCSR